MRMCFFFVLVLFAATWWGRTSCLISGPSCQAQQVVTANGKIRFVLVPSEKTSEIIVRVEALSAGSTNAKFQSVFVTTSSFARIASGPFESVSINGNFNVSGWVPTAVSVNHTITSCGCNASGIWFAGQLSIPYDQAERPIYSTVVSTNSDTKTFDEQVMFNFSLIASPKSASAIHMHFSSNSVNTNSAAKQRQSNTEQQVQRMLIRGFLGGAGDGKENKFQSSQVGTVHHMFHEENIQSHVPVFGVGAQYTMIDLQDSFVPVLTTEQGVGRFANPSPPVELSRANSAFLSEKMEASIDTNQQLLWLTEFLNEFAHGAGGNTRTTYTAMPTILRADGVGLFLNQPHVASFDLRKGLKWPTTVLDGDPDSTEIELQVLSTNFSVVLFWAEKNVDNKIDNIDMDHEAKTNTSMPVSSSSDVNEAESIPILLRALTTFSSEAGRMPLPPSWVGDGAIVALEGGTTAVMKNLKKLLNWTVPISAVWIQDWSGKRVDPFGSRLWWNWELDRQHYANWTALRSFCNEQGIRLLSYLNPYLAASGRTDLFEEAATKGFLLLDHTGKPLVQSSGSDNFTFGTVDLASPTARKWFVETIMLGNAIHDAGFSGWMADFGEYIPLNGVYASQSRRSNLSTLENADQDHNDFDYDGRDVGLELHNAFPGLWAQTNALARDRVGYIADKYSNINNKNNSDNNFNHININTSNRSTISGKDDSSDTSDLLYFSRSAALASLQHGSIFWAGDQLVSWDQFDGLQSCLRSYLSAGFSGMTLMSSDIGGYTMQLYSASAGTLPVPPFPRDSVVNFTRSELLLARWAEFSAFADVIFRSHVGNLPLTSAQIYSNKHSAFQFAFAARLHMALQPYRHELIQEAVDYGWPVVRHMLMQYPNRTAMLVATMYKVAKQYPTNNVQTLEQTTTKGRHLEKMITYSQAAVEKMLLSQFSLGRDVIVAPIMNESSSSVDVYLPEIEDGPWMTIVKAGTSPKCASSLFAKSRIKEDTGEKEGGRWVEVKIQQPGVGHMSPFFYRNKTHSQGLRSFITWLRHWKSAE